jgi:hypothetical protein
MPLLRLSDIVSGAVCVSYDLLTGKKASVERFGAQVAYRVVGRKANEMTSLPTVNLPLVSENDLYTGATALADSKLRKRNGTNAVVHDGLRATLSSVATTYIMNSAGIVDKVLV